MAHLSEAAVAKITEICDRYADQKTPLMMILSDIQKEYGYIPLEVQELVSKKTGISVSEIGEHSIAAQRGQIVVGIGVACDLAAEVCHTAKYIGVGAGVSTDLEEGGYAVVLLQNIQNRIR